ncbi:hypothetical protein [Vannielia litorea]|uniref:hypothetical protein n=1 Tax=Vannielia litorea TaxID=1217970 RepID=UPI001BCC60AF|nr:hypothetical protein [Vannielia litorea]
MPALRDGTRPERRTCGLNSLRNIALVLLAPVLVAACRDDPQAALLEGAWVCTSDAPDYALTRQVSYAPDGTLSGRTGVESTDAEAAVAMQFAISGTWAVTNGTLSEKLETHRLMRFAREGKNIPLSELPTGFITEVESTLAGQAAQYQIVTISAEKLVLSAVAEDLKATCEKEEEGK